MTPEFLQAAQITPGKFSGVLPGFLQGQQAVSGILNTLTQRQELPLEAQKIQIAADEAKSKSVMDQLNWEIAKQQLGLKEQMMPYQVQLEQAKAAQEQAGITKIPYDIELIKAQTEKARAEAQKSGKELTPGQKKLEEQSALNFAKNAATAGTASDYASNIIDNVNSFVTAYDQLPSLTKGLPHKMSSSATAALAYSSGYGGAYNVAQKNASQLVQNSLNTFRSARISNKIMELMQQGTLSLDMSQEGVNRLSNQIRAVASVVKEKPKFYGALSDAGITSSIKAEELWDKYQTKYPIIGSKGNVQMDNLEMWQEFIPGKGGAEETTPIKASTTLSRDEWITRAKKANPKASEQELKDYYNNKYGGQ